MEATGAFDQSGYSARFEARNAASRGQSAQSVAGIAPDPLDQMGEIDELVGLTAQLVRHHRRLGRNRRYDRHPDALSLDRFDQRSEVAIAGEQDHEVEMRRHVHGVDRKLDVHIALDFSAPRGVDELFRRLGHDRIAIVIEPVDQRPNRRILLIINQGCVIIRSNQSTLCLKFFQETLIVDIEPESFGACIEICSINKQGDPFQ